MTFSKLLSRFNPWFWSGLASIFLFSAILRFWGLEQFNKLVFDEVYFAKFANNYLTRTEFFDAHPPLGKYLIAIGIWINSYIPFGNQSLTNDLTGSLRSTFSYRWLNAVTGSFIPVVVAGIAYQLTYRYSYALIASLFVAADGLFLVESRYALVNVYLVIFGLIGQWFLLLGLSKKGKVRAIWFVLAGIFLGASATVKWNGLGFLLGVYLIWAIAWIFQWLGWSKYEEAEIATQPHSPLQALTQLNILHLIGYFSVIPFITYRLAFIPHIQQNPKFNFWALQKQILSYHQRIGNSAEVHPYCSLWYSWPLSIRPVAYYYEQATAPSGTKVVFDVHALGNPVLWWLSAGAIAVLIWMLFKRRFKPTLMSWTALFLVANYATNWLPWVKVTRCAFIYHYMGASVFAFMAIALFVDRWLHSPRPDRRILGIATIAIILLAFFFWLPVFMGSPLTAWGWRMRIFLPSWV